MIADGYTGRKGKGGFYRLNTEGGKRVKELIDLKTGNYAPSTTARLESADAAKGGLKVLVSHKDKGGQYAWSVLSRLLTYAASLVPEIADNIVEVDQAMKTGFNFKRGPFEMIDQMGAAWFAERLRAEKMDVPKLLDSAAKAGGFYKVDGGRLQLSRHRRRLSSGRARRRRAAALRHQADGQADPQERLGLAVGHRRRRRLPRVPQQDERPRPGFARPAEAGAGSRRQEDEGAGDPQRGGEFLRRRQCRPRACSPPMSACGR